LAPVVTVNEEVIGDLNPKKVDEIIKMVEEK
jgi:NADH:ubiquinone oxidoreductase subunit E